MTTDPSPRNRATPRRWPVAAASIAGACLTMLGIFIGQLRAGRNPLTNLRTDYWHDQLGYLAIVANVRNGHVDLSEPVTTTGVSHYPSFYYSVVGTVARVFGLEAVTAWNVVAFTLQFCAALTLAFVLASLSRRWWVALLAPVPFFTGTFAYLQGSGEWFWTLERHAVLWGPYGVLLSNNAETAGLCIGIIAVSLLMWVWFAPRNRAIRAVITIASAAAIGMLSSFQTYSFLLMTYLLCFGTAVAGIMVSRRRILLTSLSLVLTAGVFLVGSLLAAEVGQLPTLVFGTLPALPGLVAAIVRSRGFLLFAAGAAVAAALPQVLYTAIGILSGDPFLTYRVDSNRLLGIITAEALFGSLAVLVPLLAVFIIGLRLKDVPAVAVSGAGVFALPLLAVNDIWGANAEPYRFWIEGLLLGGVLAALGLARLIGLAFPRRAVIETELVNADTRPLRAVVATVVVVSAVLWTATLPDWINSQRDDTFQAAWDPGTPRERAIAELSSAVGIDARDGLITAEPCIDNRTAKATSGAPWAFYHLGMAWPDHREEIDLINFARNEGRLDFDLMRETNTQWVLTDSNCTVLWDQVYADRLDRIDAIDYALEDGEFLAARGREGTITLWRVPDTQ